MASKTFIILFVILSMSSAIAQNGDDSNLMPCVQKILPCEPYLKSTSPPATCCIPLKEVVANDQKCLCAVFNNPELLRNFNVTQDEALKLAAACQANADVSICKPLLASWSWKVKGAPIDPPPAYKSVVAQTVAEDYGIPGCPCHHNLLAFTAAASGEPTVCVLDEIVQ
ncbi:lipid transfer-like protein VAS [Punica granatum]|uniref:Lipid transfer-like protein VAS n=1 Tax=Punica granatum TaxID=22663 RepID=A0A6P8EGF8_PUNGR|nr:lipid transfer-like protein VAS [Punica granatum]